MIRLWQVVSGVVNGVLRSIAANDDGPGLLIAQQSAGKQVLALKDSSGNVVCAYVENPSGNGGYLQFNSDAGQAQLQIGWFYDHLRVYPLTEPVTIKAGAAGLAALAAEGANGQLVDIFTVKSHAGGTLAAFEASGDIRAPGGFKDSFGFMQSDVAAGQSAVAIPLLGASNNTQIVLPYAGSVIAISVAASEARTAGTLTVEATINGTATGLQAQLNAANPQYHSATQAKDADAFVAGSRLGVKITTPADWAPTTADIVVAVVVEL